MITRRVALASLAAGALDVPAAAPVSHQLRFSTPAAVWDEALPLGNGWLGALVWGDGRPLRISLDRSDLWDLRPVPEFHSAEYTFETVRRWHEAGRHDELKKLLEAPYNRPAPTKIPAGRIELDLGNATFAETWLTVEDAVARVRFQGGALAEVFVHATDLVGMMRLGGVEPRALLKAPPFSGKVVTAAQGSIAAGDLAQLGYPAPRETSGPDFLAYEQEGWNGFRFAVFLGWRREGGAWLGAWSIATGERALRDARERARAALGLGFDKTLATHRAWWTRFWNQSQVRLPNATVERQWYLEQHKFGSAARRGAPPITLQAVWTADNGQLPPWKGDYHHDLNTQLSYWPCYSGNHLEDGLGYLDWLWKTRETGFAWTKQFFSLPGLNIPMTADLNGNQIGGWRQYTHSATTAAWLAHHFYLHWRRSRDRVFLRERAYPYLRDAAVFLEAYTARRDAQGKRTHPLSASPEIHDNKPEAWFPTVTNYDLALERWLFGAAAELAGEVGLAAEAKRWRTVLAELPEFAIGDDGRLLVAAGQPLPASHRHFSHLMALHPLGLISDHRIWNASLDDLDRNGTSQWCGYSFSWLANLAARAGDGAKAERALEIFSTAFCLRNGFHCNGDQSGKGYSTFRYRPFTLEGNFAAAAGVQEMLLASHSGVIRVFPAVPDSWREASFVALRADGAFLVSAERAAGRTARIEVTAEAAGRCRLADPFGRGDVILDLKPGERKVLERT